jgi:hypothetical protein
MQKTGEMPNMSQNREFNANAGAREITSLALALFLTLTNNAAWAVVNDDWYPASIEPPPGHHYPCKLQALPRHLPGIDSTDHTFINHIFSMILQCLRAKLVMIDTLYLPDKNYDAAYSSYYAQTIDARRRIVSEPEPPKLKGFKEDLIRALDSQMVFFQKAVALKKQGGSIEKILEIEEAKKASSLLMSAWSKISAQYGKSWDPAVKDSIYHHLCALDVF